MATAPWDDDTPPDSQSVSLGDDRIREDKAGVRERLLQGGHYMVHDLSQGGANEINDGQHVIGVENDIGAPTEAGTFTVFRADITSPALRLHGTSHATKAGQLELDANYTYVGANVTTGTDPGHLHTTDRTLFFPLPGTLTAAASPVIIEVKFAGTIEEVYGVLGTTSSSGSVVVDVWKANAAIPSNSNSIHDSGGKLTFTSGTARASTSTFDSGEDTVAANDVFKVEVESIGTGAVDLNVFIRISALTS